MEIRTISKNIIQFEFETENELTENITVLFSGNKCSIIDTGEKGRIKKVLGYLNERGVKIENIFISHFHPDHFGGLEDCLGKIIYGSKKFKKTMDKYEWEIPPYLIPHKYYENEKSVIWEEFQIEFISIPGHSICSTGLVINNDTLFVGDAVMKDKHDKIVIPYICIQDIQIAINSINRIKEMKFKKLLLAHGKLIIGITKIQEKLDKMNTYLNELLVYEDKYLRNNVIFTAHRDFAVSKWHEHNLENVYRTIQK